MPSIFFVCIVLTLILMPAACEARHRHIPGMPPNDPVGAETISLGTNGLCLGIGHHNTNGPEHVVLGLRASNQPLISSYRAPYDFMKQWTSGEACGTPSGWSTDIGIQYGAHIAQDSSSPYFGAGYHVQLGPIDLQLELGAFAESFNSKRPHTPRTINAFGMFPFGLVEVKGHF